MTVQPQIVVGGKINQRFPADLGVRPGADFVKAKIWVLDVELLAKGTIDPQFVIARQGGKVGALILFGKPSNWGARRGILDCFDMPLQPLSRFTRQM